MTTATDLAPLRLGDEDLETILAIARNEQSGRITPSEVRELVRTYRAHTKLYEALKYARRFLNARDVDVAYIDTALAKADGQERNPADELLALANDPSMHSTTIADEIEGIRSDLREILNGGEAA